MSTCIVFLPSPPHPHTHARMHTLSHHTHTYSDNTCTQYIHHIAKYKQIILMQLIMLQDYRNGEAIINLKIGDTISHWHSVVLYSHFALPAKKAVYSM